MSLFNAGKGVPAITLSDMLAVEDTPELLAFHCPETRIPVWPNIRAAFYRQIMADLLFATGSIAPPMQRLPWRAAGAFGHAVAHNARAVLRGKLRADVIINTEAVGDELRDDRWFNRYVDPFGDLPSGQAVMMMDMFEWRLGTPRYNERIYHHAPIQAGAVLAARLSRKTAVRGLAQTVTALACDRAESLLGWRMRDEQRAAFTQWTARKLAGLPFRYRAYRRLMQRVRPRLLLGSSGCYGIHAPLIAAARDLGIVTAEYQHGVISAGHDAYNFAPAVFASDAYRRTLPQYLLTYGSWWAGQIAAPVECAAIGYPARAMKLDKMAPWRGNRRIVLVLGDGIEFELYLDLARAIAQVTERLGLEVALRPHPLERTNVLRLHGERVGGVRIDTTPDIYASFAQAHSVVSELSTGLFEAVGLVDRIVLLNTAKARFAFPEHPFAAANSAQEVIDLIQDESRSAPKVEEATLWAPDWQDNYLQFLAQVGIQA